MGSKSNKIHLAMELSPPSISIAFFSFKGMEERERAQMLPRTVQCINRLHACAFLCVGVCVRAPAFMCALATSAVGFWVDTVRFKVFFFGGGVGLECTHGFCFFPRCPGQHAHSHILLLSSGCLLSNAQENALSCLVVGEILALTARCT